MRNGNVGHTINSAGYNANYYVLNSNANNVPNFNPLAYYTFQSNGNDNTANPSNFGSYSSTTGIIGNGHSHTNGSILTPSSSKFNLAGDNCMIACWVKITTPSYNATQFLVQVEKPNLLFGFAYQTITNVFTFSNVYGNGKGQSEQITISTTLTPNTWYFICQWFTGNTLYGQINNGTVYSTPATPITFGGGTTRFSLYSSSAVTTSFDELGWWKGTIPDNTQRTYLYNSGSGRTFDGSNWS